MVNRRAARSLCRGVVAVTSFSVMNSSSSLDESYRSKDDGWDPGAVAEVTRLLLGTVSSLLTGTH